MLISPISLRCYGHVDSYIFISLDTRTFDVIGLKIQRGHLGVTGVKKVIFTKNAISHSDYMVCSRDSCICISLTPSTKVIGLKIQLGSRWGHRGQKGHFHQNCYFSFRLHGMVTWLMHIHQLDPLYKSYRIKNSPGVTWGHRGQKVIFTKNAISPSDYMVWSRDSCIYISLTPSTKVIGLKIHPGSLGVTGVKRSFSPKMLFLTQITWYVHVTHAYTSAWPPLQKLSD